MMRDKKTLCFASEKLHPLYWIHKLPSAMEQIY